MRVPFEQVAVEDSRIFSSDEDIEDAMYGYLAMLFMFGWTHLEYCNELLKRIDDGWTTDVQDQAHQS